MREARDHLKPRMLQKQRNGKQMANVHVVKSVMVGKDGCPGGMSRQVPWPRRGMVDGGRLGRETGRHRTQVGRAAMVSSPSTLSSPCST